MTDESLSPLLARQLKKLGLSSGELPTNLEAWQELLKKIGKTYLEYDEARISADNIIAVSLKEMESMQEEKAKLNADILKELDANLSLILQASDLGVWDWDLQTNIVNFDERWCQMLGYTPNEIPPLLSTFEKLIHPNDLQRVMQIGYKYISGKSPKFDVKFLMKHKLGHWINIHAKGRITKVDAKNNPLRFMGTHADITEETKNQKEMENQKYKLFHQSKLASLGEMSAGIAHEINNPLAIILGSAELLTKFKDNPEKFNAKIESILKSCKRISKILNGLKKFSRSADKSELKKFNLAIIVEEVILLTNLKASRFLTTVTKECPPEIYIDCDDLSIEQVLINLINNGIDAVREQEDKWVKITAHEEGSSVILRVIDSGPTIPIEIEDKIFDPFFTTKKVGDGTGLGLSITKGILEEHSASININREFKTTCFEIKFFKSGVKNAA